MSKLSTPEKFFIGRILYGLEQTGNKIEQEDIELLLSQRLEIEDVFKEKIKNALIFSYCDDIDKFNRKIVTLDPKSMWDESLKKLYKGRETVLRDLVVDWYSSYFNKKENSLLEKLKSFFRR
ncbi:MAG: hypothetical protein KatS3mg079_219 [Caloramator sp.]|nr:MAG: hypothetical protein KatS3mg079_219 [Caloramator sp.]